jgi:hypothetical protein
MIGKDETSQPPTQTSNLIEGSFLLTVIRADQPPFPNLIIFTADGGIVDAPPDPHGFMLKSGIGSWAPLKSLGGKPANAYIGKVMRFLAVPEKDFVGREEISLQLIVSTDGQSLSGEFQNIVFDFNGVEVNRGKGKLQGTRIVAQKLPN